MNNLIRGRERISLDMTDNKAITALLREYFSTKLSNGFNTIDMFASDMQISPKKLQRLLNEENTTFSAELNNFRRQKAKEFLSKTKTPLWLIANNLGYSSREAFNTACKRWFGCSPTRLRSRAGTRLGDFSH